MREHLSEKLQRQVIINGEKIKEIRNWIENHYAHESEQQKAKMLAKHIHRVIDEHLPDFSKEKKTAIRQELIQERLLSRTLNINAHHIVTSSAKHVSDEKSMHELCHWVQRFGPLPVQEVEGYVIKLLEKNKETIKVNEETLPQNEEKKHPLYEKILPYVFGAVAVVLFIFSIYVMKDEFFVKEYVAKEVEMMSAEPVSRLPNALSPDLQFTPINEDALRAFLKRKNSLLVEEPYFSTILHVAERFNIHPLLLFAITGQEQGFVPKDAKDAYLIANNPFNVYYSWQEFNTNILDSSEIAARTILHLSENRPEEVDPIKWINQKYAEDQNWWVGVSAIFEELSASVN